MSNRTLLSKRNIVTVLSTVIFFLLSHAYRMFNLMYSHDSLSVLDITGDMNWQVSLGRYGVKLIPFIRGTVSSPSLLMWLFLIYLVVSVCLIINYFDIKNNYLIVVISGVMSCNITVTLSSASYISWLDIYGLALLMAVSGAYLLKQKKYIVSLVCLVFSLSLYPAYFSVAIGMIMVSCYTELSGCEDLKKQMIYIIKRVVLLIISAVLYFVIWKLLLACTGMDAADSTNGVDQVGSLGIQSIISNLFLTYKNYAVWIFKPYVYKCGSSIFELIIRALLICAAIVPYILAFIIFISRIVSQKKLTVNNFLQTLIVILFPFGLNFCAFLTSGVEHELMMYAFIIPFIFVSVILDNAKIKYSKYIFKSFVVLMIFFIYSNVIYSNQVYNKKALDDQQAYAFLNRIVTRVEMCNEYEEGETPVVLIGSLCDTDSLYGTPYYRGVGMTASSITYSGTLYNYCRNIMGVNMDINMIEDIETLASDNPELAEKINCMDCFPKESSIQFIDDTIYVRLSD
ncbi:MAG: glucosyltransferase domain-containing protein [Lachnospiraceae bacterium]|nr:glucosyltransferase domain-containing protein [Lachnospiraceae bacterium]